VPRARDQDRLIDIKPQILIASFDAKEGSFILQRTEANVAADKSFRKVARATMAERKHESGIKITAQLDKSKAGATGRIGTVSCQAEVLEVAAAVYEGRLTDTLNSPANSAGANDSKVRSTNLFGEVRLIEDPINLPAAPAASGSGPAAGAAQ
jgi:hypothetical protein